MNHRDKLGCVNAMKRRNKLARLKAANRRSKLARPKAMNRLEKLRRLKTEVERMFNDGIYENEAFEKLQFTPLFADVTSRQIFLIYDHLYDETDFKARLEDRIGELLHEFENEITELKGGRGPQLSEEQAVELEHKIRAKEDQIHVFEQLTNYRQFTQNSLVYKFSNKTVELGTWEGRFVMASGYGVYKEISIIDTFQDTLK